MFSLARLRVFATALLATALLATALLATASFSLLSPFLANGASPLKVVSTAAPVHALLVSLTKGAQQPRLLLAPNLLPHGARLTPSQARLLHDADLLVLVGGSFAAFESSVEEKATRRIIRLTELEGITTLPLVQENGEGHDEEKQDEAGQDEEKHDEEGHDEEKQDEEKQDEEKHDEAGQDEAEHHHKGGIDPHVWLDIENVRVIVERLAEALAERDSARAALYRKNARKLDLSLRALDREVRAIVGGLSGDFLVLHDATAYFTARYAIHGKERLSAARHNATRDGMRHTLRVRQKLRRGDYRCVVVQPQLPREVRERFLGSGTRVVVIDPLGASLAEDKDFYASLLRSVAEGFRKCLVS